MLKNRRLSCGVILTAAGKSERFGGNVKKPFALLKGEALISHSIKTFLTSELVKSIVITAHKDDVLKMETLVAGLRDVSISIKVVGGGASRQESVAEGFMQLEPCDFVMVHDAARPMVTGALIDRLVDALRDCDAVIPAEFIVDTVKWVENGWVKETIPRSKLVRVQTPQCFKYETLKSAYRKKINTEMTDESMLVEAMGVPVKIVLGEPLNVKVTSSEDLALLEAMSVLK